MKNYTVYPEVPASYSPDTIFDRTSTPLRIEYLSLLWEGSLGSDLFELSPIFFATQELAKSLEDSSLTGLSVGGFIDVKPSENLLELDTDPVLPILRLLTIETNIGDDFYLINGVLNISQSAFDHLQIYSLEGVDISVSTQA